MFFRFLSFPFFLCFFFSRLLQKRVFRRCLNTGAHLGVHYSTRTLESHRASQFGCPKPSTNTPPKPFTLSKCFQLQPQTWSLLRKKQWQAWETSAPSHIASITLCYFSVPICFPVEELCVSVVASGSRYQYLDGYRCDFSDSIRSYAC